VVRRAILAIPPLLLLLLRLLHSLLNVARLLPSQPSPSGQVAPHFVGLGISDEDQRLVGEHFINGLADLDFIHRIEGVLPLVAVEDLGLRKPLGLAQIKYFQLVLRAVVLFPVLPSQPPLLDDERDQGGKDGADRDPILYFHRCFSCRRMAPLSRAEPLNSRKPYSRQPSARSA